MEAVEANARAEAAEGMKGLLEEVEEAIADKPPAPSESPPPPPPGVVAPPDELLDTEQQLQQEIAAESGAAMDTAIGTAAAAAATEGVAAADYDADAMAKAIDEAESAGAGRMQRSVSGDWEDEAEHPHCQGCKRNFTVMRRRHHCRRCGNIVCGPS